MVLLAVHAHTYSCGRLTAPRRRIRRCAVSPHDAIAQPWRRPTFVLETLAIYTLYVRAALQTMEQTEKSTKSRLLFVESSAV